MIDHKENQSESEQTQDSLQNYNYSHLEPEISDAHAFCNECYHDEIPSSESDSESELVVDKMLDEILDDPENINISKESISLPQQFSDSLSEQAALLASKWYTYPEMPRKRVQNLVEDVTQFINGKAINILRETVLNNLKSEESIGTKIQAMFNSLKTPFLKLDSEYLRMKHFSSSGNLIQPLQYKIGEREEFREENGKQISVMVPVFAQYISLREIFQKFFELPGMYNDVIKYIRDLKSNSEIISNLIQADYWKEKCSLFENETRIPLIVYFDDYETNNVIGSHSGVGGKCGAVYVYSPCLPIDCQSELRNIFLFGLFNSLDRKVYTNKVVFEKLLKELKYLSEIGIQINHNTGVKKIFFDVVLFVADNLGIHTIFGYNESFRSNYPCVICRIQKEDINKVFHERQCELRDRNNYDADVAKNNPSLTGIKDECVFHELNFHCTVNVAVDIQHDLYEGVCPLDVAKIFCTFIEKKFFTLTVINDRIQGFHFSRHDKRNKPPEITEKDLKNKRLRMSSAEMLCLIRNLPMIIGDRSFQ